MRRTKIICTIGPKTESEKSIRELAGSGMNIARINMSHGNPEWNSMVMKRVRKASQQSFFPIGLMIDTQGPEIRTSANTEVGLNEGDIFKIAVSSACDIQEGEKHTFVDYKNLIKKVKKGNIILIDNGLIALEVLSIEPHNITCKVLNKGNLGKKKSVNLPGIRTDLPAITEKDVQDITLGVKNGADFIAQSFVRRKQDVREMRSLLDKLKSNAMVIAKIEDQEGVDNMDEIILESDGVMVARGDLGVEVPFENIPIIQKAMVKKCIAAGKPVIIATHLLESMIENPRPTRAEVTDVANAVFEKADCIMLSGETTKGNYPAKCVATMDTIAKNAQNELVFDAPISYKTNNVKEAITFGACINAENLNAKAIIVFTKTGRLLSLVTKNRPNLDIFAFTDDEELRRKLIIYWGTFPFLAGFNTDFGDLVSNSMQILKKNNLIFPGERVVVVSDISPKKNVDILEIIEVN